MDLVLTPEYRTHVNVTYRNFFIARLGLKIPAVPSAEALIEVARRCADPEIEAEHGWRTEPPFPGAHEPPERTPNGWRMICASRIFEGEREIGVIFATFYGGKPVVSFVNGPGSEIPANWRPVLGG